MGSTTYSRWLDTVSNENELKQPKLKLNTVQHPSMRKALGIISASELNSRSGNTHFKTEKMHDVTGARNKVIKLEDKLKESMINGKSQNTIVHAQLNNVESIPKKRVIADQNENLERHSYKFLKQSEKKMKVKDQTNETNFHKNSPGRHLQLEDLSGERHERKKLKTGRTNTRYDASLKCDDPLDLTESEDNSHLISHDGDEDAILPMSPKWDESIEKDLEAVVYKMYRSEPDPEDEDTWDVSMVAEYAPEIFNHMRDLETKYAPYPYYIPQIQSEITWENRATLINWIVQVHSRFGLLPETLYLTVNLIDRFLSKRPISLSKFQLCGAVALFIAAKYEEINCPTVKQIAYMVSNQYTTAELLKAERFMISDIDFDMGYPGPMSFLRRTSKADNYDSEIRTLAKYFLEITIMDPRFVAAPPSWLASGASYLSLKMLHRGEWTEAHTYYSGYTEAQLKPLAEILIDCCLNYKTHHSAIFDKYASRKFKRSSLFVQDYLERELYK